MVKTWVFLINLQFYKNKKKEMTKNVIVIGGGIAGMEASAYLSAMGFNVTIFEKEEKLGGHLLHWERLFPTKRLGSEVLDFLKKGMDEKIGIHTSSYISKINSENGKYFVTDHKNVLYEADAILVTTGYDLFDARKKEEYGYGIYDNVITSAELEAMFLSGKPIVNKQGKSPERIGFVHCVGSRDRKVGNVYCSKVCCVTAVKQATEIREHLPDCETYCFYMDLRMYGSKFEELYNEAQEKFGVTFIRGRLSEANETMDGSLLVKVEDTLVGRPLKMTVDLLVLMVGFEPSKGTREIADVLKLNINQNGFIEVADEHTLTNVTNQKGVFVAGTSTTPRTITNTINDARAAAAEIASYLNHYAIVNRGDK
jgi:heterodisulfide reductase subunit A